MTTDTIKPDSAERTEDEHRLPPDPELQRCFSDIYSFWSLCEIAACRRAGRCTGDASHCCDVCMPLISDIVYEGGQCLLDAKLDGLDFDQAMKRWPDELASLWAWKIRIENRRGAPRPQARVSRGRSRA